MSSAVEGGEALRHDGQTRAAAYDVVTDCIALSGSPEGLSERIAELGWEPLLSISDSLGLGSVLATALQRRGDLVPAIPAIRLPDGRLTIPAVLDARIADHAATRLAQTTRLRELVAALNAVGIKPMALKGARSLWLDGPEWRSMRDLDLLVPRHRARAAQDVAMRLGYNEDHAAPRGHHHQPNLYRADLPGWLEFHDRAGVPRVEALLGTRELWAAAMPVSGEAGAMLLPPSHLHVLHSMLHHHIGHGGDREAAISLKGLYEFAAETGRLDGDQRALLVARAARHPRLLAIFDLWTAAAANLFRLPVEPPLTLARDAEAWWGRWRAQLGRSAVTPYDGRTDELAAATDPARLARVRHPILRYRLPARLATMLSFVQRPRL